MAEPISIICRSAPLADQRATELAEMLVTAAAFALPCQVFFIGDGVLQLVGREPEGSRGPRQLLAPLPDYGVSDIFADQQALENYDLALDDLLLPVTALSAPELASQLAGSRHCFGW